MTHFQVSIQLPLKYNPSEENAERKNIEEVKFIQTYNELLDMIGGISINQTPIKGAWVDPTNGIRYDDENRLFSVLVESEDKISALKVKKIQDLVKYKETLKERFQQKEIYMVAVRCSWL